MPAKSKAQQRFFGVVKSIQKGTGKGTGKAKKAAKDMTKKDVDDFASTKHKGLPNKVKREQKVRNLIKKMVREALSEGKMTSQLKIPMRDRKKVVVILKKIKAKEGKDFDFGVGKGSTFVLDINKKFTNKFIEMAIQSRVQVSEGFAGGISNKKLQKEFEKQRGKNAEQLGYTLSGKSDIKTEIGKVHPNEYKSHFKALKEGKLKEDYKNSKWEVYVGDDAYGKNRKVVKVAKSKRAATILYNKLIKTDKYFEVGMRAVTEGKLNEKMDRKKAAVLLKQLGGNRFIAMTGAKGFAFSNKYMSFKIGRNSKGINFVRIGHNAKDLYDLEFGFVSVKGIKVKKKVKDVYADMLGQIFTKYTGMHVRL